ncbi:hypothetical protein PFISCL1PPCAC_16095, partial [Pristionchus fissidentatus]
MSWRMSSDVTEDDDSLNGSIEDLSFANSKDSRNRFDHMAEAVKIVLQEKQILDEVIEFLRQLKMLPMTMKSREKRKRRSTSKVERKNHQRGRTTKITRNPCLGDL